MSRFIVGVVLGTALFLLAVCIELGARWIEVGSADVSTAAVHSLFHINQHGPKWVVGDAPSIEGGALFTLLFLASTAIAYAYASFKGKRIEWQARLDAEVTKAGTSYQMP